MSIKTGLDRSVLEYRQTLSPETLQSAVEDKRCQGPGCARACAGRFDSVCQGCRTMRYCSAACQSAHWRAEHRRACPRLHETFRIVPKRDRLSIAEHLAAIAACRRAVPNDTKGYVRVHRPPRAGGAAAAASSSKATGGGDPGDSKAGGSSSSSSECKVKIEFVEGDEGGSNILFLRLIEGNSPTSIVVVFADTGRFYLVHGDEYWWTRSALPTDYATGFDPLHATITGGTQGRRVPAEEAAPP